MRQISDQIACIPYRCGHSEHFIQLSFQIVSFRINISNADVYARFCKWIFEIDTFFHHLFTKYGWINILTFYAKNTSHKINDLKPNRCNIFMPTGMHGIFWPNIRFRYLPRFSRLQFILWAISRKLNRSFFNRPTEYRQVVPFFARSLSPAFRLK